VYSVDEKEAELDKLNTDDWTPIAETNSSRCPISKGLNGKVSEFGLRFWETLGADNIKLKEDLSAGTVIAVTYTDRYVRSPWAILILGQIIEALPCDNNVKIELSTLYEQADRTGHLIFQDWDDKTEMNDVIKAWFQTEVEREIDLHILDNKTDIPHYRELVVAFANGNQYVVDFDQGVGFWRASRNNGFKSNFEFMEVDLQIQQMRSAKERANTEALPQSDTIVHVTSK
jgi:hypothetical protein